MTECFSRTAAFTLPSSSFIPRIHRAQYRRQCSSTIVRKRIRSHPTIFLCNKDDQSSRNSSALAATAAAALILLGGTSTIQDFVHPKPAQATALAPTPINPYAKRSAERAYEHYIQKLESSMEELPLGDLKKVVKSGGGGMNVSYRIAGFSAFVAAMISVLVVHPLDSIKTRVQAEESGSMKFAELYKGVIGNILKEAPNAAIYLGVYEIIKSELMKCSFFHDLPLLTFLIAGALGDGIGSIVRVPAEVINKKLQLGISSNFLGAAKEIFLEKAGRINLLNSWSSVLLRDVPFGGIQIMLYEFGKSLLEKNIAIMPHFIPTSGLSADILVGSIVGAFTAFVTTPADVLVTRMAMSSSSEKESRANIFDHMKHVVVNEGCFGFFRGSLERSAYYFVLSALFFGLYETTSRFASNPAYFFHQLDLIRESLCVAIASTTSFLGPGVLGVPPQYWTTMFLFAVHELPVLLSFLSYQR